MTHLLCSAFFKKYIPPPISKLVYILVRASWILCFRAWTIQAIQNAVKHIILKFNISVKFSSIYVLPRDNELNSSLNEAR